MRTRVRSLQLFLLLLLALAIGTASAATLPPPAGVFPTSSFGTAIDLTSDCRIVAFDGFTVFVQDGLGASTFSPIGALPPAALGTTDPAFVAVMPGESRMLLGAGFGGGLGIFDPAHNGKVWALDAGAAEATHIATIPYHVQPHALDADRVLLSVGDATFSIGSVQLLDLGAPTVTHAIVTGIPGSPGGVALAANGDLLAGLGFATDLSRNGEIRRFDAGAVAGAIAGGAALDWESDGTFFAQILSAAQLVVTGSGDVLVGGGDSFGITGSFGFFAVLDGVTGAVKATFDPSDDDPTNGSFVFYALAHCDDLGITYAVDLNATIFGSPLAAAPVRAVAPLAPFSVAIHPATLPLSARGGPRSLTVQVRHDDRAMTAAAFATGLEAHVAGNDPLPLAPQGAPAAGLAKMDRPILTAIGDTQISIQAGEITLGAAWIRVIR